MSDSRRRVPLGTKRGPSPVVGSASASAGASSGGGDTGVGKEEEEGGVPLVQERDGDAGIELGDVVRTVEFGPHDMSMIYDAVRQHHQDFLPHNQDDLQGERLSKVEVSPRREEEERYLMEPMKRSPGRPCIAGVNCVAMRIPGVDIPTPCIEHHGIKERTEAMEKNLPLPRAHCILCKRYIIMWMYIQDACEGGSQGAQGQIFHSHGNMVEPVPQEYILRQCIVNGTQETHGVLLPCAMFCLAWITPERGSDGVLRFKQDQGYKSAPDFREAAAGAHHLE